MIDSSLTNNIRCAIGIDFGTRHIGLAAYRPNRLVGVAIGEMANREGRIEWQVLDREVERWKPDIMVVGLPLSMDGSSNLLCKKARHFAQQIAERYRLVCELQDERLTTKDAEYQAEGNENLHALSAKLILSSWWQKRQLTNLEKVSPPSPNH